MTDQMPVDTLQSKLADLRSRLDAGEAEIKRLTEANRQVGAQVQIYEDAIAQLTAPPGDRTQAVTAEPARRGPGRPKRTG